MASSYEPHAAQKTRALAAFNITALPLDSLYEILLRLPAKLLCRLRTVCRLWRSILSDPQFAAVHATRHPGPLIMAAAESIVGDMPVSVVNIMDLSGQILKRMRCVPGQEVVSMALDLVCLKTIDSSRSRYRFRSPYFGYDFFLPDQLLNPATGAVYQIPDSFAEEHVYCALNFVSDPIYGQVTSTGEYKVFRKLIVDSRQCPDEPLLEICTINSGSHTGWRAVAPLDEDILLGSVVVIDGIVYSLRSMF